MFIFNRQVLHYTYITEFPVNYVKEVDLHSDTVGNDNGYQSSHLNFQSGLDLHIINKFFFLMTLHL